MHGRLPDLRPQAENLQKISMLKHIGNSNGEKEMRENREEKVRAERKKRVPFGVPRRQLNLDDQTQSRMAAEGKIPRWVNDGDGRLLRAQDGGYEFVMGGGAMVGDAKDIPEQDRRIRKLVGKNKDGSPKYAYLMAIPAKYHDEDQAAKEATNRKVDEAILGGAPPGLSHHGVSPGQGGTRVKNIEYQP